MKKFFALISITVIMIFTVGICYAAPLRGPQGYSPAVAPEATNTLLSAVTSTGTGTAVDLGMTASKHMCIITLGGQIPTNVVVKLEGSIDNSYWFDMATHTFTTVEKVANGTFTGAATSWTEGAGWSYAGNAEPKSGAGVGTLSQALASMTSGFVIGQTYLLNYDATLTDATGGLTPSMCGVTGTAIADTDPHTYVAEVIKCTAATGDLTFTPGNTALRGTMDNISLVRGEEGFAVADVPARYIRGHYYSKSGGGTTTAVTLSCTSGGN